MTQSTILTVTSNAVFLSHLRDQLHEQVGSGTRMIVTGTIDEACSLMDSAHPRIVIVHMAGDTAHYEQMNRLLWTISVRARRIPVLVVADRYRTEQATMLFRMGVTEYVSRTHHLDQLGRVFAAYFPRTPAAENETATATANGDAALSAKVAAAVVDQVPRSKVPQAV